MNTILNGGFSVEDCTVKKNDTKRAEKYVERGRFLRPQLHLCYTRKRVELERCIELLGAIDEARNVSFRRETKHEH